MSPAEQAVARLAAVFGEPRTPDPTAFFDEFARALTGYAADAIDAAVSQAIRECTYWPKPAEVIERARSVLADRTPRRPPEHMPIGHRIEPSPEQKARVRALLCNVVDGLRAVDESRRPAVADWRRGQRPGISALQRERPEAHRVRGLTETSRRMAGERDEEGDTYDH